MIEPLLARDLVGSVQRCARDHAAAVAVQCGDEQLTFAELDRRADRLGGYLAAHGVTCESLVAVFLERSVDMYVAVLGIQRAGGAYLPIDPAYPVDRIAFMLADSGAAVVVTHEALRTSLPQTSAHVVSLDRDRAAIAGAALASPPPADPHRLAYTIYTSGSTGRPKGVSIEHGSVLNLLDGISDLLTIGAGDTLIALAPLAFDMSVLDVYLPLTTGARIVVASRATATNPKALVALMESCEVTHMQATPSAWRMLVEAQWNGQPGLTAIAGGEALPPALADHLLDRVGALWNLYGPTEATVWATAHRVTRRDERPTIGRPMRNVSTYVLDADRRPVPAGVVGDLFIGGDGLARGYLHRPDLTAERFIANPVDPLDSPRIYHTGDVARLRDDGCIEFLGRSDQQVKLRGYRIELGEVESALERQRAIQAAVVTVREDTAGDPRLIAYVVGAPGDAVVPDAARRALLATLPAYMVPDAVVVLDALPLNANGKVDRGALPRPAAVPRSNGGDAVAPRTPIEARLAAIWEDVLDLRPIGVTDDFFDLGATSIAAARVFDRIERELGADLPLSPLFAAPTIERLAALIERGSDGARWSSLVPVQPNGTKTPLFFVHGGAGTILHFHALARRLGDDQPLYGLQMRGLYGDVPPNLTVEAMADHYIAELRSVQPHGPYAIGGYCFGAIVAYEMAQRLTKLGERVAVLASINGPSPAYIKRFGGPRNITVPEPVAPPDLPGRLIFAVKRTWWTVRWQAQWAGREGIRNRFFDARTWLYGTLRRRLPDAWRRLAIYRICHVAEKTYRARPYAGSLLVFHGAGLYRRDDLGWATLVGGELQSHESPGFHETQRDAMFEPHVAAIAETLSGELHRAFVAS